MKQLVIIVAVALQFCIIHPAKADLGDTMYSSRLKYGGPQPYPGRPHDYIYNSGLWMIVQTFNEHGICVMSSHVYQGGTSPIDNDWAKLDKANLPDFVLNSKIDWVKDDERDGDVSWTWDDGDLYFQVIQGILNGQPFRAYITPRGVAISRQQDKLTRALVPGR
jgi:hypothetical protein